MGRQYAGSAGKITNCQVGVFAAYVSNKGHAFIDRQLYLPKAWAHDLSRRAGAHVPAEVAFATKPQLARAMMERAIAAGVPFAWVAADSVYGVGDIEMALRRAGKGYVLGVKGDSQFNSWVGKPLRGHRRDDRRRPRPLRLAAALGGLGQQGRAALRVGVLRTRRPGSG